MYLLRDVDRRPKRFHGVNIKFVRIALVECDFNT